MTLAGFVTLVVIAVAGAVLFLALGALPGKKARERGHPQADAINILGWIGLLMGVLPWVVALIWAHANPLTVVAITPADSANIGEDDTE